MKALVAFARTDTGLTAGNCTLSIFKDQDGGNLDSTGWSLTEIGEGLYIIDFPVYDPAVNSVFSLYPNAEPTHIFDGTTTPSASEVSANETPGHVWRFNEDMGWDAIDVLRNAGNWADKIGIVNTTSIGLNSWEGASCTPGMIVYFSVHHPFNQYSYDLGYIDEDGWTTDPGWSGESRTGILKLHIVTAPGGPYSAFGIHLGCVGSPLPQNLYIQFPELGGDVDFYTTIDHNGNFSVDGDGGGKWRRRTLADGRTTPEDVWGHQWDDKSFGDMLYRPGTPGVFQAFTTAIDGHATPPIGVEFVTGDPPHGNIGIAIGVCKMAWPFEGISNQMPIQRWNGSAWEMHPNYDSESGMTEGRAILYLYADLDNVQAYGGGLWRLTIPPGMVTGQRDVFVNVPPLNTNNGIGWEALVTENGAVWNPQNGIQSQSAETVVWDVGSRVWNRPVQYPDGGWTYRDLIRMAAQNNGRFGTLGSATEITVLDADTGSEWAPPVEVTNVAVQRRDSWDMDNEEVVTSWDGATWTKTPPGLAGQIRIGFTVSSDVPAKRLILRVGYDTGYIDMPISVKALGTADNNEWYTVLADGSLAENDGLFAAFPKPRLSVQEMVEQGLSEAFLNNPDGVLKLGRVEIQNPGGVHDGDHAVFIRSESDHVVNIQSGQGEGSDTACVALYGGDFGVQFEEHASAAIYDRRWAVDYAVEVAKRVHFGFLNYLGPIDENTTYTAVWYGAEPMPVDVGVALEGFRFTNNGESDWNPNICNIVGDGLGGLVVTPDFTGNPGEPLTDHAMGVCAYGDSSLIPVGTIVLTATYAPGSRTRTWLIRTRPNMGCQPHLQDGSPIDHDTLASFPFQGPVPKITAVAEAVLRELITKHSNVENSLAERITQIADDVAGGSGGGSILFTWTEYAAGHEGDPDYAIPDVTVVCYANDSAVGEPISSAVTDEVGEVKFYLDPGTYYLFRRKAGRDFDNPAEIEVS